MKNIKPVDKDCTERCCKKVTPEYGRNIKGQSYRCNKPATHTNGISFFCRHHAKVGRYVIRKGDVGEIVARFDTEEELRKEFPNFNSSKYEMQKVTKSHRSTILPETKSTKLFDYHNVEIYVGNILNDGMSKTYLVVEKDGDFMAVHEPSCGSEREGVKPCKEDLLFELVKYTDIEVYKQKLN